MAKGKCGGNEERVKSKEQCNRAKGKCEGNEK